MSGSADISLKSQFNSWHGTRSIRDSNKKNYFISQETRTFFFGEQELVKGCKIECPLCDMYKLYESYLLTKNVSVLPR